MIKIKSKKMLPMKQPSKPKIAPDSNPTNAAPQGKHTPQIRLTNQSSRPKQISQHLSVESVCTDLLQDGSVQAYIDMFYISHQCIPNLVKNKNYFGLPIILPEQNAEDREEQTTQQLQQYKQVGEKLASFETNLLANKQTAMQQIIKLAARYEGTPACYFYNRAIQIYQDYAHLAAGQTSKAKIEGMFGFGKCLARQNQTSRAIDMLKTAIRDSQVLEDYAEPQAKKWMKLIGEQLIQIYLDVAAKSQHLQRQIGMAAYESALQVAKIAGHFQKQVFISQKIANLYYESGEITQSIEHQKNYLQLLKKTIISKKSQQGSGEQTQDNELSEVETLNLQVMSAYAGLAKCYLKIKDLPSAQEYLDHYHKMATQANIASSIAQSSYYLAKLFEQSGDTEKILSSYEQYFLAAKSDSQRDQRLIDKARVSYVLAKGRKNFGRYLEMMGQPDSLERALRWREEQTLQ